MRRRGIGRGRPSLLGTAARTAVVAGTASAVVGHSADKRQAAAAQQQAQVDAQVAAQLAAQQPVAAAPQWAPPPAPAAPGALTEESVARLKQLAELRDAGVLTPAEFDSEKAKILG